MGRLPFGAHIETCMRAFHAGVISVHHVESLNLLMVTAHKKIVKNYIHGYWVSEGGSCKSARKRQLGGYLPYPCPRSAVFDIIARRKRLGGYVGCVPPVRALAGLVIVGVLCSPSHTGVEGTEC